MINRKLTYIAFLIGFVCTLHAQYTVTGGKGTPLLAHDEQLNRIKVYLVNGMEDVEIRYTSTSPSHEWFRYKNNALTNSEAIPATQEGTSSVVRNLQEGYGYYVKETENIGMNQFIWIIDYSKYAFDVQNIRVMESSNPCDEIILNGNVTMPDLRYYLSDGKSRTLERNIEILYTTMSNRPEENRFVEKDTLITVHTNPFERYYPPPLADTEFTIRGDQFARHFDMEKSASTEMYQAVAVKAIGDTTFIATEELNQLAGNETNSLSAPAEVLFTAYANEPVAVSYNWIIYRKDDPNRKSLVARGLKDINYTFRQYGTYVAMLEVSSRSGIVQCTDSSYSVEINIRESDLQVPNVFTPGTSPGQNDEFKVAYKSLISFKGWVFNRWGVELFHWTDPSKGWDGKKNGKYLPPGAYYYIIEAKGSDGTEYKKKGHINIVRPKDIQDEIIEQ